MKKQKITLDSDYTNVLRWKTFFRVDPIYGHRLARDSDIEINFVDNFVDNFQTDEFGVVKNSQNSKSYSRRITEDCEEKYIIFVFGGSNVMGIGSGKPENTIPSLLEQRLNLKVNSQQFIVVNFGVAGWTSSTSLNFYFNELFEHQPDLIILIDGWNDAAQIPTTINFLDQESNEYHFSNLANIYWLQNLLILDHVMNIKLMLKNVLKYSFWKYLSIILNFLKIEQNNMNLLLSPFAINSWIVKHLRKETKNKELNFEKYTKVYFDNHKKFQYLCKNRDIEFLHFLQPLKSWNPNPHPEKSLQFHFFQEFKNEVDNFIKQDSSFYDLNNLSTLNLVIDFLDEGHLTCGGNRKVVDGVYEKVFKLYLKKNS